MKIYTKKGDAGETSLYGGTPVAKDDLRLRTYGTLDELNASLGLALTEALAPELKKRLIRVQNEIFQLGTELATPCGKDSGIELIETSHTQKLETEIDSMESKLKPLKNFILPGGAGGAAALHVARTICRRAERELVTLNRAEPLRAEVLKYVNRLGDYLFVCARAANSNKKISDVPWKAPGKK